MPLPANIRARSLLLFWLFAATAAVLQLALHFIARTAELVGQPGHALADLKATLFCIATGLMAALSLSLARAVLRRQPVPARIRR